MRSDTWGAMTTLACVVALCTCFAAVALHALETAAGYELGRQESAARELCREVRAAEQSVAGLRAPTAVLARGRAMGLVTEFSALPLTIAEADVRFMLRSYAADRELTAQLGDR